MDAKLEAQLADYRAVKDAFKACMRTMHPALAEAVALYRALRLPLLSSGAGPMLRKRDWQKLRCSHRLVVGPMRSRATS
ncbi:hypothetical protein [Novosphingobium sp. 9U]|uniref:hypothetical protein n=1 Tax=Novosphingobium sp. 9U TaxID=2653158 RepID=UPI0012F26206|nr:hypothetical protein [Novosphingobium sp. 9U]VWX53223.1 hypothetical protein NOVOSPHI9U_420466 [Novosphingobium sp. 9U]